MSRIKLLSVCLALLIGLGLAAMIGCDGSAGPSVIDDTNFYRASGILVEDWNRFATRAHVAFGRNDTLLDSALVWLGDQTLTFDATGHQLSVEPSGTFPVGSYDMVLADTPYFIDTVVVEIADTFSVTVSEPPNRENPGGDLVVLDWTESPDVDVYAVAAVPRHLAYTGAGYSNWAGESEGQIPLGAFRWSNGIAIDTGWYYVFAYAVVGSPDSAASAEILPVPLPADRLENVDRGQLTGRLGTAVVAGRDSVHVTLQ
jgi:hypothetical protein